MRKIVMFLVMYLFSLALVCGQSFDQLKIKLENCIKDNEIPGAAVTIATKDSVLFTDCFGFANIKQKIPITKNTHFWIGSITKSFIAVGILKLVEEGLIDLNVPVKQILPDVIITNPWGETDPVLLVHLLEHTAGLCDGFSSTFNWRYDPNIPLKEVMRLYKKIVVYNKPGSFYLYSNTGYLLAGMVIEKITGMTYEDYLKQEVLIPLKMKTTTFDPKDPYSVSVLAQGYGSGIKEIPLLYIFQRSAGQTYSSISEMAHYLMFFINNGRFDEVQIIKPESLDRMETPKTSLASRMGLVNGYGLGNEWAFRNQYKWRGHNGAGFGFYSDLWYNRDLNIGYVVLVNQFDLKITKNVNKLRELIAEYLTQDIKPNFQPITKASKDELKQYCGAYNIGYGARDPLGLINYFPAITQVKLAGDTLLLRQPLGGYEDKIFQVSPGLFREQDLPEPTVAFFNTPEGKKALVSGNTYFQELSPWKYWLSLIFLLFSIIVMLSTIIYVLIWGIVYSYKKIGKKQLSERWITVRILPCISTIVLISGFFLVGNQEMYDLGKLTFASVAFFILTWLFVILSFTSLVGTIRLSAQPVRKILKAYHLIAAVILVGMSLFLWYWGVIGLKLWN